jgi:hypothetical protein
MFQAKISIINRLPMSPGNRDGYSPRKRLVEGGRGLDNSSEIGGKGLGSFYNDGSPKRIGTGRRNLWVGSESKVGPKILTPSYTDGKVVSLNYKGKDVHVFVEGNKTVFGYDGKPKPSFSQALMALLEKSPTKSEKPQNGESSSIALDMSPPPKDKGF